MPARCVSWGMGVVCGIVCVEWQLCAIVVIATPEMQIHYGNR